MNRSHGGLLFITPNWNVTSELWMGRMLDALQDDLLAIGAKAPNCDVWRDQAPVFSLVPWQRRWKYRLRLTRKPCGERLAWRRVRRWVQHPRTEAVLCNFANTAVRLMPAWIEARVPVFVHVHGYDVTWDLRRHEDPSRAAHPTGYAERVRRLAQHVRFIANSQYTRESLETNGIPADRIEVKYFGVPSEPDVDRRGREETTFLFLGRLIDAKGPVRTIHAFDLACRRGLKGRLVVAGDGPLRSRCEQARAGSMFADRITLLGAVDAETGRRLRAEADVFTAHSQTGKNNQVEAFGVAFVEAMAAGMPVVSGRSGGLVETVVHGRTGYLFEPGDVEQHANYLLQLGADEGLRIALGAEGRRRAETCFSLEQEQARLKEILFGETPRRAAA